MSWIFSWLFKFSEILSDIVGNLHEKALLLCMPSSIKSIVYGLVHIHSVGFDTVLWCLVCKGYFFVSLPGWRGWWRGVWGGSGTGGGPRDVGTRQTQRYPGQPHQGNVVITSSVTLLLVLGSWGPNMLKNGGKILLFANLQYGVVDWVTRFVWKKM